MNVLVTNDDGYGAWGIEALIKALSKKHNVFVIAPDGNRSGNSHHVSFSQNLVLTKVSDTHWKTSGTPVDCVCTALKGDVFGWKIDAVVSGINKGENLGTDIIYSGTCGAARQAVLDGVPAVAVSMQLKSPDEDWNDINNWTFDSLAEFVCNNLETLCSLSVPSDKGRGKDQKCVFVNVNSFNYKKFTEAVFTDVCFREYVGDKVTLSPRKDDDSVVDYILTGGNNTAKHRSKSDLKACEEGKISVSRIYAEPVAAFDVNLDSIKFSL